MAKIKTILCLGNQTDDSVEQACVWAERFKLPYLGLTVKSDVATPGVMMSDLAQSTLDDLWQISDCVDLLIWLDQDLQTYDHFETYDTFKKMCAYRRKFQPVMIAKTDAPTLWLTKLNNNQNILQHIKDSDYHTRNMVIRLNSVDDIEIFKIFLTNLTTELRQRNCKWVFYRASAHEKCHSEVTDILLQHPEFVLLTPNVFLENVQKNIEHRIYTHWVDLYLRNKHD